MPPKIDDPFLLDFPSNKIKCSAVRSPKHPMLHFVARQSVSPELD